MRSRRKAGWAICPRVILESTFGLGKKTKIDSLEISWPSGRIDRLPNVPVDQIIAVKEGTGIVSKTFPKIVTAK